MPLTQENDDCAVVAADSPEEAAMKGIAAIEERTTDVDPDYCEYVFVAYVEMAKSVTFRRTNAVERAPQEYQCCGGTPYMEGGHTGHCPNRVTRP